MTAGKQNLYMYVHSRNICEKKEWQQQTKRRLFLLKKRGKKFEYSRLHWQLTQHTVSTILSPFELISLIPCRSSWYVVRIYCLSCHLANLEENFLIGSHYTFNVLALDFPQLSHYNDDIMCIDSDSIKNMKKDGNPRAKVNRENREKANNHILNKRF